MKAVVIGAGVVGVTTAAALKKAGYDVTVVERNALPSMETSFANGGQLSACHAVPWSNPSVIKKLAKWVWHGDSPLLFRPKMDLHQWKWLISFLGNCNQKDTLYNTKSILGLIRYSQEKMSEFDDKISFDHLKKGIVHYYRTEKEFKDGLKDAEYMQELGLDRREIGLEELLKLEPSLGPIRYQLAGATFTESDGSGDIFEFTSNLAYACERGGVKFKYNTDAIGFYRNTGGLLRLMIDRTESGERYRETLDADAFVVCAASFSNKLLSPLGLTLNIYPAKGYSATVTIKEGEEHIAPIASLTDDETKLVYSRLGNRLRIAGTAELNGYDDKSMNIIRCQELIYQAQRTFPYLDMSEHKFWTGLRPLTPSNRPYVGPTSYKNLFLNTGHGSLGWSMACGSASIIADIISNKKPEISAIPFSLDVKH